MGGEKQTKREIGFHGLMGRKVELENNYNFSSLTAEVMQGLEEEMLSTKVCCTRDGTVAFMPTQHWPGGT